jgi:hypothetical protein
MPGRKFGSNSLVTDDGRRTLFGMRGNSLLNKASRVPSRAMFMALLNTL